MARKAQTATEYLVILAVVIIIALIVVGVMGGIPGIGTGAKSRASSTFWATADIAFSSYSVGSAGVTLNIKNNKADSITINSISLDSTDLGVSAVTLTAGQTYTVTNAAPTCTSGSYSYGVSINYTDVATGGDYVYTGNGQKLEGSCAS